MDAKFLQAVEKTLGFEGGYANDPADPGGETNFGISARAYPHLNIKALTKQAAIEIYYRDYWQALGCDMITDPAVAGGVFDMAVNAGPVAAVRLLQRTLNRIGPDGLAEDGKLGIKSLEAANEFPQPALLAAELKLSRIAYYVDLAIKKGMGRFLAGWVRRALA
ncbi:MAG: N-acetylmuramidase [Desulfobacteraceae bacterium]|nr:N-acetylmuramidase [Desulfobacteraceae bacterium]